MNNIKQQSEDYLRFGIIEFENGHIDASWDYVSKALRMDATIDKRKHAYGSYITRIIRKYFGKDACIEDILNKYRA
ncbi:MAG: hypothetical protein P8X42_18885 [Calditrichaceae bacterium]